MLAYWIMYFLALAGVVAPNRLPPRQSIMMLVLISAAMAVLMGLRDQVGGDWIAYDGQFDWIAGMSFGDAISQLTDPGYYGLSWVVARLGGSVYTLNLICASILAAGTLSLARRQPMPWLALLVAVPYLLIVVGMGYTRQSAAIGCAMLGLVALGQGGLRRFAVWVLIGATFHKTAVLLIPIAALSASRNRIWTASWVGVLTMVGVYLFLYDSSDKLWNNYVVSDYANASQGAGIRVAMNTLPALLLLWLRGRIVPDPAERRLWLWIAALSLTCIPLLSLSPTAVDRMALYFIPLQLFVLSRLPQAAPSIQARTGVVLAVIGYCAAAEYVWLNFAATAFAWIPYHFMPLGS